MILVVRVDKTAQKPRIDSSKVSMPYADTRGSNGDSWNSIEGYT
jgi:hypothetical protein